MENIEVENIQTLEDEKTLDEQKEEEEHKDVLLELPLDAFIPSFFSSRFVKSNFLFRLGS